MPDSFVPAPTGGVNRYGSLQQQPRNTLVESVNFWPRDAVSGRRVLATRPPLVEFATPDVNVNLLAPVSGDATQTPQRTILAGADGALYYWGGDEWVEVTGSSITTGRQVFAASYLKRVFIFNDTTPLVFNYDDLSLGAWTASEGTVPADCRFGVAWRGGVWIGGAFAQPQVVSGSRTGDVFDWDFSQTDGAAAFQFAGEDEGLIGEPVTALIPASSDVMLIPWADGMSMLRGHPRRGGILEPVSSKIGCLGQGAWTQGPDYRVYFMSREGLATIDPGGGPPALISRMAIPGELVGLPFDYTSPNINLEYDVRYGGVHIIVGGDDPQAWFYDLEEGGFHEMTLSEYPDTTVRFDSIESEAASGVLFGGAANLNRFDTSGSENILARAIVGPLPLAKTAVGATRVRAATLHFLDGTVDSGGQSAVVLRGGADADDAYSRYQNNSRGLAFETTIESLLRNSGRVKPQMVANAMLVELHHAGVGSRIVYEGASIDGERMGRNRMMTRESVSDDPLTNTVQIGLAWTLGGAYASATATGPSVQTSDVSLLIDLADMPAGWWDRVRSDGGDIRVTTANNALMPVDLIAFDYANQTGLLAIRRQLTPSASVSVRVWCGNPTATLPGVADLFGGYNAYSASLEGFWPAGGGADRSRNRRDMTASPGSLSVGGLAGPVTPATRYESVYDRAVLNYTFDDSTTAGDPGSGGVRLNNSDPRNATAAYLSKTDADGVDRSAELTIAAAQSSLFDRRLDLIAADDGAFRTPTTSTWTDNTTYYTVSLSPPNGSEIGAPFGVPFTDGEAVRVSVFRAAEGFNDADTQSSSAAFASPATVGALTLFDARQRSAPSTPSDTSWGLWVTDAAGISLGLTQTQQVESAARSDRLRRLVADDTTGTLLSQSGALDAAGGGFVGYAMTVDLSESTAAAYRDGASIASGEVTIGSGSTPATLSLSRATIGAAVVDDSNALDDPQTPRDDLSFCWLFSKSLSAGEIAYLNEQLDPASLWGTWSLETAGS